MRLADLPTPCLVLDRAVLCRTLRRIQATAAARGVALRIDMQAARSMDIARLAFASIGDAGGARPGIAVSTLADAEYFAAYDVQDILYATCVTPDRLDQIAKLASMGAGMLVATDDSGTARAIAAYGVTLRVLIRNGPCAAQPLKVEEIASHLGGLLAGVMMEAPHSGTAANSDTASMLAERLAGLGHALGLVSSDDLDVAAPPVTEWRAGSDLFDDGGLTVLARVIGHGGAAALRLDAGAVALGSSMGPAGELLDRGGEAAFGRAPVRALWLEQSWAELGTVPGGSLPVVGEVFRVRPLDARLAAAAHDRYFVVDGGDEVVAVWPRVGGW